MNVTKIGYLSGPVDAREVYALYLQNKGIDYLGTSYMREFFEVCEDLSLPSVVVTSHGEEEYEHRQDAARIANFPKRQDLSGLSYHVGMIRWTLRALQYLHNQGCTHVILTDAQDYWFMIRYTPLRQASLILAVHCALELPFGQISPVHKVLHWVNKQLFYRKFSMQALAASPLISRQLRRYCARGVQGAELFLPIYCAKEFEEAYRAFPLMEGVRFELVFAGRITRSKGVFDLLEMARTIGKQGAVALHLHVAGEGPDLETLRKAVAEENLEDAIVVHGYLGKKDLLRRLRQAHAVIVPTRSEFEEGFAMICAEAIVAGRPLITSKVCPALELLQDASLEAQVDDPASYAEHVIALATNPALLQEKRAAASVLRQQFLDPANSYGAKLKKVLLQAGVPDAVSP